MTEKPPPPRLPWKTRIAIYFITAATDACRRSDGTINRRILSLIDHRAAADPRPSAGVRTSDFQIDPSRKLWFRLFFPSAAADSRLPVVVFFHGGGFAYLSPSSLPYDAVCRRFARKLPAIVLSVNYRLSPEHRCPAPYVDGFDVLRFLDSGGLDRSDEEAAAAADLSSVFLAGDSAGGNIAHHVTRRWAAAAEEEEGWAIVRVCGVVAIQPFFGGKERTAAEIRLAGAPLVSPARTDWLWKAFLPEGEDRDHEAANVFGPMDREELEKQFPATMVVVGGWDPLQDWQRRYCEELRIRGKEVKLLEYPEAVHAFYVFPELPRSGELIEEIKGFVEAHRERH